MKNFIAFICAMLLVSISLQAIPTQNVEKWPPGIQISNDIYTPASIMPLAVIESRYDIIVQDRNSVFQTIEERSVFQNVITCKFLPDIRRLRCTHNSDNYQFNKKLPFRYNSTSWGLTLNANRCRAVI